MATMSPRLKSVAPLPDYRLLLTFDNEERRLFDVKPYLNKGVFSALADPSLFRSVRVSFDTVEWANGADLCLEVLYAASEAAERRGRDERQFCCLRMALGGKRFLPPFCFPSKIRSTSKSRDLASSSLIRRPSWTISSFVSFSLTMPMRLVSRQFFGGAEHRHFIAASRHNFAQLLH